jgi:hypothetical protein
VFPLGIPALPLSLGPGDEAEFSLSFDPTDSGVQNTTISLTVQGIDGPVAFTAVGEGNFAPVAYASVTVSGAGTAAVNGTYIRTGTPNTFSGTYDIPSYELTGTEYVIWGRQEDGISWFIDDDLLFDGEGNLVFYLADVTNTAYIAPSTVPAFDFGWETNAGSDPAPCGPRYFAFSHATSDDVDGHLFVRVTPYATAGITTGTAAWLGPSPVIAPLPQ